jgi:hypothetical protein
LAEESEQGLDSARLENDGFEQHAPAWKGDDGAELHAEAWGEDDWVELHAEAWRKDDNAQARSERGKALVQVRTVAAGMAARTPLEAGRRAC